MAKCLHELPDRYKSVRILIQKAPESSSAYTFSVSFDFVAKHFIWIYDAFSVGVCSKNERAQQNLRLTDHTDSQKMQLKQIHAPQRNTVMLQWFTFVSKLLIL